jgi:hypothetical protein
VAEALLIERVSAAFSLLTGKRTGKYAKIAPMDRFWSHFSTLLQRLVSKFPTRPNREFFRHNREWFRENREAS